MTSFRVTPRAASDLEGIALWTFRNWGADRMEAYLRSLNDRFIWLAQNPHAGRDRIDVAKGYRSFPEGRHLIFYLVRPDHIAVIGLPHQAMDAAAYFG